MTREQLEKLVNALLPNHVATRAMLKRLPDNELADFIFGAAMNKFTLNPER